MTKIIDSLVDARMPTKFGTFQLYAFPGDDETKEDLALVMGKIEGRMLVRVHSECFTGDVLHWHCYLKQNPSGKSLPDISLIP